MVLVSRCCFGLRSVREGSYAAALFTLSVYLVLLTTSVFHVYPAAGTSAELLTLTLVLLLFSLTCVVSSVLLIVGLCTDNRLLLLPWLASVTASTLLELAGSFYFLADAVSNPPLAALFAFDILFCAISAYCIVCVVSQYQLYLSGRGRAGQSANSQPIPTLRLQASPSQVVPSVSYQVVTGGGCGGQRLAVPTTRVSSSSSKSHTDFSSVSDDVTPDRVIHEA